jgi:predicted nuclease of predicted toxin-antitoxin system
MILLADESVDQQIVDQLRQDGHDVEYVRDMMPGISDDEVMDAANARGALLFTADKDFGELVFRLGRVSLGVVLIRLAGLSPAKKAETVSIAFRDHDTEFAQAFSVIAPGVVRIRHSP